MGHADTVLTGARIHTLDAHDTVADSLAVRDGRIIAVGAAGTVGRYVGQHTRVLRLSGQSVLPGINDSHIHLCAYGLSLPPFAVDVGYPGTRSMRELVTAVRSQAAETSANGWVLGNGWDATRLTEQRAPNKCDLDAATSKPVALTAFSGHTVACNSAALRISGIDRDTAAAYGGLVEQDDQGDPSGVLHESAQSLLHIPDFSLEDRKTALRTALAEVNRAGITSLTEPGLGAGGRALLRGASTVDTLHAYRHLAADGELTARVSVLLLPTEMSASANGYRHRLQEHAQLREPTHERLRVIGVKLFADGVPPSGTAWMEHGYTDGHSGSLVLAGNSTDEQLANLRDIVQEVHRAGFQLGVHVTGDRAIDEVVNALTMAMADSPRADPRHYLIHGDFTSTRTLRHMSAHGIGLNTNPGIMSLVLGEMPNVVGADKASTAWPLRTALRSHVHLGVGSDAPITTPDWRRDVAAMLAHDAAPSDGSVVDGSIRLNEALRACTATGAWQDFAEQDKGTLETGKLADLCVLDQPIDESNPDDLMRRRVCCTMLGGDMVHEQW